MSGSEDRSESLRRKLEQGLPLDDQESKLLDSELERTQPVSQWVRGLPDEEPSLAWRSSLNAKLGVMARVQRRKLFWRYGSAAATACACGLAVFLAVHLTMGPNGEPATGGVEEFMVQSHQHLADTVGMDATSVPEPLLWNASM